MDEVIQSLIAGKIQEGLVLCGIGDCSDEPIKHHILGISNFVRETRLQVGIKDALPLLTPRSSPIPETTANELRGSYRLLPTPQQRSRVNYTGLDGSAKRRKKKIKDSTKNYITNYNLRKDDDTVATQEAITPVAHPLMTDAKSQNRAHAAAASLLQRRSPLSVSDPPDRYESQQAVEMCASRAETVPHDIVENILINCIRLNDPLGRFGHQTMKTTLTTRIEKIQGFVHELAQFKYTDAVRVIKQENAFSVSRDIQTQYTETIYWEIIKKGAELLDPETLPTPKGPLDEFTVAEKVATECFMREVGYGLSLANQRQWRIFWKRLFEIWKAGVDKILLYCIKQFDRFCKCYPSEAGASLVEMVRLWEEKYDLYIKQLENWVIEESKGDSTGRLWLSKPHVVERLEIPELAWNSASNPWFSDVDKVTFQSSRPHKPSATQPGRFFDLHPGADAMRNKSIFVTLLPKDETFLSVCPIISVQEGDFLGVFAGVIRYSEGCSATFGIPGPKPNLWLDYSTVTGTLNFMGVSAPGGSSNVGLQWELIDERDGEKPCLRWRVSVQALRTIRPFEELVRAAPQKEQYLLHRLPAYARRGFMKRPRPL